MIPGLPVYKPSTSNYVKPFVGMGATISIGSDSYPATVLTVSKSGKKITIQRDAVAKDGSFSPDLAGHVEDARFVGNHWQLAGGYTFVHLGARRYHMDPGF